MGVTTQHGFFTWWLPGVWLKHSCSNRAGGCPVASCNKMEEHWQLKPGVMNSISGDCRLSFSLHSIKTCLLDYHNWFVSVLSLTTNDWHQIHAQNDQNNTTMNGNDYDFNIPGCTAQIKALLGFEWKVLGGVIKHTSDCFQSCNKNIVVATKFYR